MSVTTCATTSWLHLGDGAGVLVVSAARFTCSATQQSEWQGYPASGTRFERVDEVYFFRYQDGRITHAWGLEDNLDRMRQLGHLPT